MVLTDKVSYKGGGNAPLFTNRRIYETQAHKWQATRKKLQQQTPTHEGDKQPRIRDAGRH